MSDDYWWNNKVARCGNQVLATGLGSMGVGRMWVTAGPDRMADERWEQLPIAPDAVGLDPTGDWIK